MAQEESKSASKSELNADPAERTHFNRIVLGNPNYFGTFSKLGGKVVKSVSQDTRYEHLACVGLNPGGFFGAGLLEAVIDITQHSGYGSNGCGAGSTEHVRFFVEDASGWHDLGSSSVQVFDLPGSLPTSYAVSVDFTEARKFCKTENIVHVRAILSWQWDPTPGDPFFIPVWGNVIDANVQVAPWFPFEVAISELIAEKALTIDPSVLSSVNLTQTLPMHPPTPLSYADLKGLYAEKKVPSHRFGFKEVNKLLGQPLGKVFNPGSAVSLNKQAFASATTGGSLESQNYTLGDELGAILAALAKTSGDTHYEELTCAGYNPQTRELEGVIQVKQKGGYSGSLCTAGSTEYVSFFAFFGGVWNALGTTQVQVHDLASVAPGQPVHYAVSRLSNLTSLPCEKLEGVPLRAILSWEVQPTGPNFIPVWGNVVNTHVQPQISALDDEQLRIMRIGRVTINGIDNVSGLALDMGTMTVAGDCTGNQSPFGGETIVEGDFLPRLDVFNHTTGALLPGAKPIIYQAWVTPGGGAPSQLLNSFELALFPPDSMVPVIQTQQAAVAAGPVTGQPATAQFYTYWESDLQAVNPRTLAVFEAGGLSEGNYTIELRGFKWDGSAYQAVPVKSKMIHVYNGYPHMELTSGGTLVPEQRPQVSITITSPAGDCGDVQVGETIRGTYSVTDNFFGSVSLALVPITVLGVPQPENTVVLSNANSGPSEVVFDGTNTGGTSGTFTLKTGASIDSVEMTPCGYTILLQAWDRALVSSSCSGHYNEEGVGFCLRKKQS